MFYFMTLFANLDFLIFIARHCSMLEDMKVIMTNFSFNLPSNNIICFFSFFLDEVSPGAEH